MATIGAGRLLSLTDSIQRCHGNEFARLVATVLINRVSRDWEVGLQFSKQVIGRTVSISYIVCYDCCCPSSSDYCKWLMSVYTGYERVVSTMAIGGYNSLSLHVFLTVNCPISKLHTLDELLDGCWWSSLHYFNFTGQRKFIGFLC